MSEQSSAPSNSGLTPEQVDFRAKDFVAIHNAEVDNRDSNTQDALEFGKNTNTIHDALQLAESGLSKTLEGVKDKLKQERNDWYHARSQSLENVRKFEVGRKVALFDAREHYEQNKGAYIEAAKKDAEDRGHTIHLKEDKAQ